MPENTPEQCYYYKDCSQNICPLDEDIESRVGSRKEKCLNFASISDLVSERQRKVYSDVISKRK
jgi:hypothetical protein